MGEPIRIFDKLVGLMYRLEDDTAGYNGVALLRYEGEKIWLHSYVVSAEQTPNPANDAELLAPIDLTALIDAWSAGDVSAVRVSTPNLMAFSPCSTMRTSLSACEGPFTPKMSWLAPIWPARSAPTAPRGA